MKTLTFPFVCLPDAVIFQRISSHAKVLYAALQHYRNHRTGVCNPGLKRLAERLGKSVRTLKRALAELVRAGMVIVQRSLLGNQYEIATPNEWGTTISATDCGAKSGTTVGPNLANSGGDILIEPDVIEPEERHDAAAAVVNTPWQAAAAASTDVECEAENPTPPAEGSSPGEPAVREEPELCSDCPPQDYPTDKTRCAPCPRLKETAEAVVAELMPLHPEPGNAPKAIAEAEKLFASAPEAVPATVEAIRASHAAWRVRWAEYGPGRFIPQLWRWIHDGDWRNAPAERKGVKSETWIERRAREQKESDEKSYRLYAENGMWEALRQYMGPEGVEVWRARIEAETAA